MRKLALKELTMRDMRRKRNMTSARLAAVVCWVLAFALFMSLTFGFAGYAVVRAEGERTLLALTADSFAPVPEGSARLWRLKIEEEDSNVNYATLQIGRASCRERV